MTATQRHFLNLSDAGGDAVAAMIGDAIDRKAARALLPKGQPDADAPLTGRVLAMAAGEAVLDVVANEEFLSDVRAKGERLRGRVEQFIGNYPDLFIGVRGRGLMLGLMMKVEPRPFVAHMRDNHQLLTVSAGDNTVRVIPPLVIDDSHIDEFMERLSAAAASYALEAPVT